MGKAQLELLERDGKYLSVPSGISQWPMIKGGRDAVLIQKLEEPPKRYDLVMYVRPNLQGVIHRVMYFKDGRYVICGDNCWRLEYVKPEQVKGIVTEFCHKGKWYKTDNFMYQMYVHLWTDFLFVKRPLFYLRDKTVRKWFGSGKK
ncbi:MAG: S24/S26 family peptidase [Oscillospiraceae bacterium]|nr:S24/S26 family peptidase [Oscillospiraceae bacterium]